MKQYLLVKFILFMGASNIWCQIWRNNDLQISQLEDKVWVIETVDNTTMYIIEGNDKALLIDTGTKCDSLDKIIRYITQKPLLVVITHAHPDHAGNIEFFDEIYIHPADTVLIQKTYKGRISYVTDGYIFDLGGKKITVYHMPGHTPGSIILVDKQAGSCYSGDAFGSGLVWLQLRPFSPMETYINSCTKMIMLMEQGISKIYCGHYSYVKTAFNINYMIKMKELAISINNNEDFLKPEPYKIKVPISCDKPMIVTNENVGIVYDPEHVKY